MNREIEEMARVLNECCNVYDEQGRHIRNKCGECECWSDDNHCCCSYNSKEAEALYNAGYRKSTDVVAEVLEILSELKENYLDDDDVREACAISYAEIKIVALKKKYESEGADDE